MERLPPDTVLLVIDVQQAFEDPVWGARNNHDAEARTQALLRTWRAAGRSVIHVQHVNPRPGSRFNPGSTGVPIKAEAFPLPGEPVIQKDVNSAFIGTGLEQRLRAAGVSTLVMLGFLTDHCVSSTARMASNLGFSTYIVEDATATFERVGPSGRRFTAEEMHESALASLHGEFCTVVSSAEVVAGLG